MRPYSLLLAGMAVAVGGLASGPADAQELPETEIAVIGAIGIHPQYKSYEVPFWTNQIKEKSGGRIAATVRPWTEMGLKGPEVLRLVQRGNFQIGTVNLPYNAGESALLEGHDLPGLAPTSEDFKAVSASWREPLAAHLKDRFGVDLLAMFSYSAQVLYCRDEFDSLADIKGRRVRVSGAAQAKFVEALGGSGINVSFGEVHQALDRGVVDCAITGAYSGYSAKWYESANYISPIAVNWGVQVMVANQDAWGDFDPAVRSFLSEQIATLEPRLVELAERETRDGILCNTTGPCATGEPGGMTLVEPKEEDSAVLERVLEQSVLPDFARRCGEDCTATWNATIGSVVGLTAGE